MEDPTRFILRWERDKLYGWHSKTSFNGVVGFVMSLEMGYELPAVDIVARGDSYYLCGETKSTHFQFGGHHRAIAHYILSRPLECNLWKEDNDPLFARRSFHLIGDSILKDDSVGYTYYDLLREADARKVAAELGERLYPGQRFLDSKDCRK